MLIKLLFHTLLGLIAFLLVPSLVDTFSASLDRFADPITAVVVALLVMPAIKPMFD